MVLRRKLDRYGVDHIDLLVVSHVHADHIEGLRAVVGEMPVGAVWTAFGSHHTPASDWLVGALDDRAIPVATPPPGTVVAVGGSTIEVLGPIRRIRPGFARIPLDVRTDLGITTLMGTITLTPGTLSADLSEDRRELLVHYLDEVDETELVAGIKRRYERPIREVFG